MLEKGDGHRLFSESIKGALFTEFELFHSFLGFRLCAFSNDERSLSLSLSLSTILRATLLFSQRILKSCLACIFEFVNYTFIFELQNSVVGLGQNSTLAF